MVFQYKHEYNNQYNCVSGWRLSDFVKVHIFDGYSIKWFCQFHEQSAIRRMPCNCAREWRLCMFISSVQCTIVLVIINIVAIYGLWKSSEIARYQITQLSELFLDDFVCSYLRFSARLVQCVLWRHIIPPFDSVKQYQPIPHNSFSHHSSTLSLSL
jgi:hypothetical protein